ncbi:MAG: acyl carrier protein [Deltaproteobacteria bacterium]|jgi:acyl carrier protein
MSDIRDRLARIVSRHATLDVTALGDDQPIGLDSLGIVLVHGAIEDDFGVRLSARDVTPAAFESIGALVRLVQRTQETSR